MLNLSAVRIHFFAFGRFQEFSARGSIKFCNASLLESRGFFLLPLITRKFKIIHSVLGEHLKNEEADGKQVKRKVDRGLKVCVVMENSNRETYMYMKELEKYAMRKKLNIVPVETEIMGKPKYKLVEVTDVFNTAEEKKDKSKKVKHILLRSAISKNDLQIKINQMLKFLEKNFKIVCVIDCENHKRKEDIVQEINASELSKHKFQKQESYKRIKLTYEPKPTEVKNTSEI